MKRLIKRLFDAFTQPMKTERKKKKKEKKISQTRAHSHG